MIRPAVRVKMQLQTRKGMLWRTCSNADGNVALGCRVLQSEGMTGGPVAPVRP